MTWACLSTWVGWQWVVVEYGLVNQREECTVEGVIGEIPVWEFEVGKFLSNYSVSDLSMIYSWL